MPIDGSQLTLSTNWKPALEASNRTQSSSESAKTIRLVHSAV